MIFTNFCIFYGQYGIIRVDNLNGYEVGIKVHFYINSTK